MTPTREDLIQLLTKQAQLSIAAMVAHFGTETVALLRVLKNGDDFEPCAPRAEEGHGFAWRLSSLAVDPRVRAAAITHHRDVERPPQTRRWDYTSAKPAGSAASVLLDWLRANPGEWTLAQVAEARGVGIGSVREQVKVHRAALLTRLEHAGTRGGKHLLISLKPPRGA